MYSQGYNLLFAYVYIREKVQINNFNDADYYSNTFRWQDSNRAPASHHRGRYVGFAFWQGASSSG